MERIATVSGPICLLIAAGWLAGCGATVQTKPTERKYYQSPLVRQCLQLEKERRTSESAACWQELVGRLDGDPGFQKKAELSDADVAKIRSSAARSVGRSQRLRRELDACVRESAGKREQRLACLEDYLQKHGDSLTVSERFEIENAITETKRAGEQAAGNIEATIEHAGKLLGCQLHAEQEGLRLDAVEGGPLAMAGGVAQELIVAVDDVPVSGLDGAERIAALEACEDHAVSLLLRHGELNQVAYTRVECRCGNSPQGRRLWQVVLPTEACTEPGSPELALGLSWCYDTLAGELEVEAVCAGSPAAAAGVQPGHRYSAINDTVLLGRTLPQLGALLASWPGSPLQFRERGGALSSPSPIGGAPLSDDQRKRCWQAIDKQIDQEAGAAP